MTDEMNRNIEIRKILRCIEAIYDSHPNPHYVMVAVLAVFCIDLSAKKEKVIRDFSEAWDIFENVKEKENDERQKEKTCGIEFLSIDGFGIADESPHG